MDGPYFNSSLLSRRMHAAWHSRSLGYFGEDDLPEGPSSVPMVFFFAKGHSIMMHRLNQVASSGEKKYSISLTSY